MRLGSRKTIFTDKSQGTVTRKLYGGADAIFERHRHRYEVNPEYVDRLESKGLSFIGKDSKGERMIILELAGNFMHTRIHSERSSLFRGNTIPSRIQDAPS